MKIKKDEKLGELCYGAWRALEPVREERDRNIRYKNGVHWAEIVDDPENKGVKIKEEELITREGRVALKHNFINQLVRNIVGQVIKNPTQSVIHTRCRNNQNLNEVLTNTLQASLNENKSNILDIEVCEEILMTGISCTKVRYGLNHTKHRGEGILSNVNFNSIFFNDDLIDCRMTNLKYIGELHDMTMEEVIHNFAISSQHEKELRKAFKENNVSSYYNSHKKINDEKSKKLFDSTQREGSYRIIELWQKEGRWIKEVHDKERGILISEEITDKNTTKKSQNELYRYFWKVTFLTPDGYILKSMETPFDHNEHPYVFAALPIINGDIKSLIGDLIDIQRYINRLIIMIDFIIGSSAKGVLMIPENAIPDGYSVDDFTKQYVKTNGVIVYKPNHTREVPFQITSNSTNVGAWEMLNLQMNMMQQISGISGAIQGMNSGGMMGASLYSQQAENSQLNYQVLFETMKHYKHQRDEKLLSTLLQYYKETRIIGLCDSCKTGEKEFLSYEPDKIQDLIDFQITITQSINTPIFRGLYEDILMDMLKSNFIDLSTFLKNSSLPFADKLLSQIEQQETIVPKIN